MSSSRQVCPGNASQESVELAFGHAISSFPSFDYLKEEIREGCLYYNPEFADCSSYGVHSEGGRQLNIHESSYKTRYPIGQGCVIFLQNGNILLFNYRYDSWVDPPFDDENRAPYNDIVTIEELQSGQEVLRKFGAWKDEPAHSRLVAKYDPETRLLCAEIFLDETLVARMAKPII